MHLVLRRPAIDEQTGREQDGAGAQRREAVLGLDGTDTWPPRHFLLVGGELAGLLSLFLHVAITLGGKVADANHGADAEAQEREPRVDAVEAVLLLKERRDAREHDVQVSVRDADKDVADGADGRKGEQLERPQDGAGKERARGQARVELGAEVDVASLLDEAVRLALEEHGRVGLAREEEEERRDDAGDDDEDPKDPSPGEPVGDDAANDGPDDGAQQGADGEAGHGGAALLLRNHVGDAAAAVGHGAGAKDAGEEAEDDESVEGGREGAADEEGYVVVSRVHGRRGGREERRRGKKWRETRRRGG